MINLNDQHTAKNVLIQKILCVSNFTYDTLKNLSVIELYKKLNELPSPHPHNGFGSLKWKHKK